MNGTWSFSNLILGTSVDDVPITNSSRCTGCPRAGARPPVGGTARMSRASRYGDQWNLPGAVGWVFYDLARCNAFNPHFGHTRTIRTIDVTDKPIRTRSPSN